MLWMTKIYKNPIEVDNIALFAGVNPSFECLFPTMCWLSPQCWLVTLHVCSIVVHLLLNPSHHHHHSLSLSFSLSPKHVFSSKKNMEHHRTCIFHGSKPVVFLENHQLFLENLVFLGFQSSMDTLAEASPDAAATKLRKERLSATWGALKQGCATRKHGEERNELWGF